MAEQMKFLDETGLGELWARVKANFGRSVSASTTATTASVQLKNNAGDALGSAATISAATQSAAGVMTATDKAKLDGMTGGAQPNQNAFANVTVGSTNIQADAVSDTLTLAAGSNVTLTPDATNDKVTIAATDTTYSDVTAGGASGLMSGADKTKIDGIAAEATKNAASSTSPKMNGTAAAGSESAYSRGDHVHPTDTSRAPLASPSFTGEPKAPTAAVGTNTTQIATTAFVVSQIAAELADITGISFEVVTSLPSTGETGVIYLVSNGGSGTNGYDEYIWLASATRFEKIGTTEVDLSGYATTSAMNAALAGKQDTMAALAAAEIDAI